MAERLATLMLLSMKHKADVSSRRSSRFGSRGQAETPRQPFGGGGDAATPRGEELPSSLPAQPSAVEASPPQQPMETVAADVDAWQVSAPALALEVEAEASEADAPAAEAEAAEAAAADAELGEASARAAHEEEPEGGAVPAEHALPEGDEQEDASAGPARDPRMSTGGRAGARGSPASSRGGSKA